MRHVLVLRSVYSELSLYLDNCSHENILSFHSGILIRLFSGLAIPEGSHTSHMWQIPTNCPALTVNSRSPRGLRAQSCWILFPWQTYSTHQTEWTCSCTQTPNNRMLVLGQKRLGPPFVEGGDVSGWSNMSGVCSRIILCDVPLNRNEHQKHWTKWKMCFSTMLIFIYYIYRSYSKLSIPLFFKNTYF